MAGHGEYDDCRQHSPDGKEDAGRGKANDDNVPGSLSVDLRNEIGIEKDKITTLGPYLTSSSPVVKSLT